MKKKLTDLKYVAALLLAASMAACNKGPEPLPAPGAERGEPVEAAIPPPAPVARKAPRAMPPSDAVEFPFGAGPNQPVALDGSKTLSTHLAIPRDGSLVALAVEVGTYGNTSNGNLVLKACVKSTCVSGSEDMLSSIDNTSFPVHFDSTLAVKAGDTLDIQIKKEGGDVVAAVWTYPAPDGSSQSVAVDVQGGDKMLGRTIKATAYYAK